jgi:DNA-directed RNA polymerase specialized sigma24 family protein
MTPRAMREPLRSHDFVQTTIEENAGALLRLARRVSLCADDAEDAYQRAVEIFLRRVDSVEPETAASWLRTVINRTIDPPYRADPLLVPSRRATDTGT